MSWTAWCRESLAALELLVLGRVGGLHAKWRIVSLILSSDCLEATYFGPSFESISSASLEQFRKYCFMPSKENTEAVNSSYFSFAYALFLKDAALALNQSISPSKPIVMISYMQGITCPIPEWAERFWPIIHPSLISSFVKCSTTCFPCPKVRLASPPAKTSSGSRWKVLAPKEFLGSPPIGPRQPYYLVETRKVFGSELFGQNCLDEVSMIIFDRSFLKPQRSARIPLKSFLEGLEVMLPGRQPIMQTQSAKSQEAGRPLCMQARGSVILKSSS